MALDEMWCAVNPNTDDSDLTRDWEIYKPWFVKVDRGLLKDIMLTLAAMVSCRVSPSALDRVRQYFVPVLVVNPHETVLGLLATHCASYFIDKESPLLSGCRHADATGRDLVLSRSKLRICRGIAA